MQLGLWFGCGEWQPKCWGLCIVVRKPLAEWQSLCPALTRGTNMCKGPLFFLRICLIEPASPTLIWEMTGLKGLAGIKQSDHGTRGGRFGKRGGVWCFVALFHFPALAVCFFVLLISTGASTWLPFLLVQFCIHSRLTGTNRKVTGGLHIVQHLWGKKSGHFLFRWSGVDLGAKI